MDYKTVLNKLQTQNDKNITTIQKSETESKSNTESYDKMEERINNKIGLEIQRGGY